MHHVRGDMLIRAEYFDEEQRIAVLELFKNSCGELGASAVGR